MVTVVARGIRGALVISGGSAKAAACGIIFQPSALRTFAEIVVLLLGLLWLPAIFLLIAHY
ncbi:MAG TPA: hypothetical protein VH678_25035 [Xanthobacteraceae bacterium]|jgi:hypothetical protein